MITMQDIFNRINEEKRIKFNKTNTFIPKEATEKQSVGSENKNKTSVG